MFESKTFDVIMDEMIAEIKKKQEEKKLPSVDLSEGSFIYTALAPAASKIEQYYIDMDAALTNALDVDNMDREHLILKAKDKNIEPKEATGAVYKAEFDVKVSKGTRFSLDDYTFYVGDAISDLQYELFCEQTGSQTNNLIGDLTAIGYVGQELSMAKTTELLRPGTDIEETEAFRTRYKNLCSTQSTGGNISDYKIWAEEVSGVGNAYVKELWNGNNTVKVVICDDSYHAASNELVKKVYDHIETKRTVGAKVTVISAQEVQVSVSANVSIKDDITISQVNELFKQKMVNLMKETIDSGMVSYAKVGNILFTTTGVNDHSNLKINNETNNLVITKEQVAVIGTVSLEEVDE